MFNVSCFGQQPGVTVTVFLLATMAFGQTPIEPLDRGREPDPPLDGDQFGIATAVDGRWLVVGAPTSRTAGEAFVYKRGAGGAWAFAKRLRVSQQNNPWRFGSSVAMSSGFVVGGAPDWSFGGEAGGAIYVFYSSDAWRDERINRGAYGQRGDEFGHAVSISGAYIIVGAPGDDYVIPLGSRSDAGSAFVFELGQHEAGKWTWIDQSPHGDYNIILRPESPANGGRFGHSVCLSGEYAAVGAPGARKAYVFKRSADEWVQVAEFSESYDNFGWSVSISGEYVAVGAPGDASDQGKAYVYRYERTTASWEQDLAVTADDGAAGDRFGESVSIVRLSPVDVKLAVGAPYRDLDPNNPPSPVDVGAVYVYTRTGQSGWGNPPTPQEYVAQTPVTKGLFGSSVYLNPESLLVGAPVAQDESSPAGKAYAVTIDAGMTPDPVPLTDWQEAYFLGQNGPTLNDFDRDGWSDLYFLRGNIYGGERILNYNNHGNLDPDDPANTAWTFGYVAHFDIGPRNYAASAGDFDNDGYPDIATEPRAGGGRFWLLWNRGSAAKYLLDDLPTPPPADDPYHADWNFFALDHDQPPPGEETLWYYGDNKPSNNNTETICWGDVDGNGYLDIFIPAYREDPGGSPGNYFLWNRWQTHRQLWESATEVGLTNDVPGDYDSDPNPEGAQFVDYDFDGDLDLYSNAAIYQNRWPSIGGEPADPFQYPELAYFSKLAPEESGIVWKEKDEGAVLFDYDMDGDFDLCVSHVGTSGQARVFENRGDGSFFDASDSRAPFPRLIAEPEAVDGEAYGMSVADWDNDGDLDLTTEKVFRQNMLVESLTSGNAAHYVVAAAGGPADALAAWADLDKDGDVDCIISRFASQGQSSGLQRNTTYDDPDLPEASRRFVRVRPATWDPDDPDGPDSGNEYWENEYGASVEVRILGDDSGLRRRQFTSSSAGYLNQNEYVLTFAVPSPIEPAPEKHFAVVVDFPMRADQGMWRVDEVVNSALADIDLSDLYGTYREITVWRTGHVCIDGPQGATMYAPDGISPRMLTAGGGLALPQPGAPLPSTTLGDAVIGMRFSVSDVSVRIREIVVDGQLDSDPNAPCEYNIVLWKGVQAIPVTPLVPGPEWATAATTSPRNNRSYIPVDVELGPGSYQLFARVTEYRGAPPGDPDWGSASVAVQGGILVTSQPLPDICTEYIHPNANPSTFYVTFRFTELTS